MDRMHNIDIITMMLHQKEHKHEEILNREKKVQHVNTKFDTVQTVMQTFIVIVS